MRVPTPKQMSKLAALPVGTAVVNPRRHDWRPLYNHGWVEAAFEGDWADHSFAYDGLEQYLPALRITADGLRALADALDKHGQPEMVEPQTQVEAIAMRDHAVAP
jgi:hypothetical protein